MQERYVEAKPGEEPRQAGSKEPGQAHSKNQLFDDGRPDQGGEFLKGVLGDAAPEPILHKPLKNPSRPTNDNLGSRGFFYRTFQRIQISQVQNPEISRFDAVVFV